ncbi:NFACT family protein [Thermanaerovibrio acidaminovorans]|uniref:NFACT family protein n=1 Tax=Thermanaerovibrio acidaminovorans TaxID=81462 RepID=UPI002492A9AE|nr:NFACT family protein [Thermanaerovibrio acidaminovorans]
MALGAEVVRLLETTMADLVGSVVDGVDGCSQGVTLEIRCRGRRMGLLLSWWPQMPCVGTLTRDQQRDLVTLYPKKPPMVDLLRGHLSGARLSEVRQINRDRVLLLGFSRAISSSVREELQLMVEMIPHQPNLCLVSNGSVVDCLRRLYPDSADRILLPHGSYSPPPAPTGSASSGLSRGLSNLIQNATDPKLSPQEVEDLLYRRIPNPSDWMIRFTGTDAVAVPASLPLEGTEPARDLLGMLGRWTVQQLVGPLLAAKRKRLIQILDRKLEALRSQLPDESLLKEASRLKAMGEVLMSLPPEEPMEDPLEVEQWPGVEGPLKIQIPPGGNPIDEAQRLFKDYRRLVRRYQGSKDREPLIKGQMGTLLEQRAMLHCPLGARELAAIEAEVDLKGLRQRTTQNPHSKGGKGRKVEHQGLRRMECPQGMILVGLSAQGNREVTFRLAKPSDIWFHVKDIPGSHVIFRPRDPKAPMGDDLTTLLASIAAWFSPARGEGKVWVDYTERRNLRPLPEMGIAGVRYRVFRSILVEPMSPEELGL